MSGADSSNIVPGHVQLALLGAVAWLTRAEHLLLQAMVDDSVRKRGRLDLAVLGLLALRRRLDQRVTSITAEVQETPAPVAAFDNLQRLLR